MKVKTPALDWGGQRRLWNIQGWCAREACPDHHANLKNSGNGLLYCRWCAHKIAQGGMVTFEDTTPKEAR